MTQKKKHNTPEKKSTAADDKREKNASGKWFLVFIAFIWASYKTTCDVRALWNESVGVHFHDDTHCYLVVTRAGFRSTVDNDSVRRSRILFLYIFSTGGYLFFFFVEKKEDAKRIHLLPAKIVKRPNARSAGTSSNRTYTEMFVWTMVFIAGAVIPINYYRCSCSFDKNVLVWEK